MGTPRGNTALAAEHSALSTSLGVLPSFSEEEGLALLSQGSPNSRGRESLSIEGDIDTSLLDYDRDTTVNSQGNSAGELTRSGESSQSSASQTAREMETEAGTGDSSGPVMDACTFNADLHI